MKRKESNVVMTVSKNIQGVKNTYRLIRAKEASSMYSYSLFVTTVYDGETDEEFCYGYAADRDTAILIANKIINGGVTACTLIDTIHDLLIEEAEK